MHPAVIDKLSLIMRVYGGGGGMMGATASGCLLGNDDSV